MSIYITVPQPPKTMHITFEMMAFGEFNEDSLRNKFFSVNDTWTRVFDEVPRNFANRIVTAKMIERLTKFNLAYQHILADIKEFEKVPVEKRTQVDGMAYHIFRIPKKSGGWRTICAPREDVKKAQRSLKDMLSSFMMADYHNSAYAYVGGRCTVDSIKKHQSWESKWFAKFDFHDFFGSTTKEFVLKQFAMIYPFNYIMANENGRRELEAALDICFLDGGLPQGTPISPWITNCMMIPIDHYLRKTLHEYESPKSPLGKDRYIYTRYADDMLISCRVDFDVANIQKLILDTLQKFDAPFSLNVKKTRYGNSNGRNWNLGVMLNNENKITVGHENKKKLKGRVTNYVLDRQNGTKWELDPLRKMQGIISYYEMVEGKPITDLINSWGQKFGLDIKKAIIEDIKSYTVTP